MSGYDLVRHQPKQDTEIAARVKKAGDTMTGDLNFNGNTNVVLSGNDLEQRIRFENCGATRKTIQIYKGGSSNNSDTGLGVYNKTDDIVVCRYKTDNTVDINVPTTINQTLTLTKTQDLSGNQDNKPALIVGGTSTQAHLELDSNEIHAKRDGTTPADIFINSDGGKVYLGGGVGNCYVEGTTLTAPNILNSASLTTKNVAPYNNADGSIGTHDKRFGSVWATTGMGVENAGNDQWCSYDAYRTINNTRYLVRYGVGRTEADGVVYGCSGIEINVKPTQTSPTESKARVNLTSDKVFSPDLPSNVALGRRSVRWKEVWAGTDTNNVNGYVTLPNGYVLMWGTVVENSNATESTRDITYPIKVTTPFRPVVSTEDLNGIMVSVLGTGNTNGFRINFKNVASGVNQWQVRANWYCIGKL